MIEKQHFNSDKSGNSFVLHHNIEFGTMIVSQ